jgi:hypothetical protein
MKASLPVNLGAQDRYCPRRLDCRLSTARKKVLVKQGTVGMDGTAGILVVFSSSSKHKKIPRLFFFFLFQEDTDSTDSVGSRLIVNGFLLPIGCR